MSEVWGRFSDDPRAAANSGLRAGDADRDVVQDVLSQAYAEGRLAPAEHEERITRLATSRTLGELVPLMDGLIRRPAVDLEAVAVDKYRRALREAVLSFVSVNAICWGIWALAGRGFPWPVFVTLFTAINVLRVRLERTSRIERDVRKLEKKQRTELPGPSD